MNMQRILNKGALALMLTLTGAEATNAAETTAVATAKDVQVHRLQINFTEAFLIKGSGKKLILVEAGVPNAGESMEKQIRDLGFDPHDISLVILTHGHGDHAGSARYFQEKYQIPIAGSVHDLDKYAQGKSDLTKSEGIGPWAAIFRPVSDLDYPAFTPDVLVKDKEIDITPYGIPGKIIPMPGHTPGSLVVRIGNNLFAGDLFRGSFKPQNDMLVPDGHHVTEHVFHENRKLAKEQLQSFEKLMGTSVDTVWPTHWGPMTADDVHAYIRNLPLLDELSSLHTQVLNDIVSKKTDLLSRYLSDDATLIPIQGSQYDKTSFINEVVNKSETTLESIMPEDFRIIHATPTTAVMNYKESVKYSGEAKMAHTRVTIMYIKEGMMWKVISLQATPIQG